PPAKVLTMKRLMRPARRALIFCLAGAGVFTAVGHRPLGAQRASAPELDALKRLTWRSIGPANQAGRISVIVGVPGDPSTFFVAGANGGLFETTTGGTRVTGALGANR